MTSQSWWWDIVRRIFASLDSAIYGLVQTLYQLFAYISRLTILNNDAMDDFRTRIYMILGIIMLFKIAFSLISLLMNPDDLMDSKKGVTGIVKRIMISLVLVTFLPAIFTTAFRIQSIVLEDNIIGQFFLGNVKEEESTEIMANSGNLVAFRVLSAFYYPSPKLEMVSETDCVSGNSANMPNIDTGTLQNERTVSVLEQHVDKCGNELEGGPKPFHYLTHYSYNISEYLGEYVNEEAGGDGSGSGTGYYAMQYSWLISTIAGVVVAWMFLGFCIDVAIRAVKLGVLQLIAPIPIFSYIDPKKGETIFQNWVKTTISTYLSLFGRLILIYFVLYICNLIQNSGVSIIGPDGVETPIYDDSMMGRVAIAFIYIGLLLFAKDAPKLFSDMFGIKMEGTFGTKLAKMGMAGTALATGLGAAKIGGGLWRRHLEKDNLRNERNDIYEKAKGGPLTEAQAAKVKEINQKLSIGAGAKQIGRGAFIGFTRGALAGKGGKVNLSTYRQTRSQANAVQKRRENGVSFAEEQREKFHENLGMGGTYGSFGKWSDQAKELRNQISEGEKQEKAYFERYINDSMDVMQKMRLNAETMKEYDKAIKSGDRQKIVESQGEIIKEFNKYYSTLSDLDKKALGSAKSIIGQMEGISQTYAFAKDKSIENQKLKKDLGKLEDNLKKNEGK